MMDRLKVLDWGKFTRNLVLFTAPALGIFFGQLASGVNPKAALFVALLALYGALADFFKKFGETK
jgi:hypothetical protein